MALIVAAVCFPSPCRSSMQFVEAQYGGPVLDGAYALAASPDGHHLYAAGYYGGIVALFSRDTDTGELTLSGTQRDGVGGVDGLDSVVDVAVSSDGRHLYALGYWDNGVAVFSRDGSSGQLTFVEVLRDGVGGVDGIEGAETIEVSPDNRHVYVAGSLEDSVVTFSRDSDTGRLTFVEALWDGSGGVEGIFGAAGMAFSPDSRHLYVAGYFGDSLAVFSRDSDTGKLTFVEAHYDGIGGVDGLGAAYRVALSPDGVHLYVAGQFDDALALFERDPVTGCLTYVQAFFDGTAGISGLAGPTDLAVSPDGAHLYAASWFDDSLVTFVRDPATGMLSFVQVLQDDTAGVDGLFGARSVVVSADGAHIYVAGEYDNAVGVFSRDSVSGQASFIETQIDHYGDADGLYGALDVVVSPDGGHVYAAGYDDDSLVAFARDQSSGGLTFVEAYRDGAGGINGLRGIYAAAVSPDGAHVYTAAYKDDAVSVFKRDSVTGRLTYVQSLKDGVGGVDGLDGARALAVSPDGGSVYVAGYTEDAVSVFARNSLTGALAFSQVVRDNTDGVDGLDGVRALSLAPDGRYLYTAGRSDSAVAVFRRDTVTGQLTFVEMQRDGSNGVNGLYGARALALSSDGSHLYVTGHYDDAVAVFARDADTGCLTYMQMYEDGTGGVDGLNGACDVVVSPDGQALYTAGYYDSAAVFFTRDTETGQLAYEQMAQDGINGVDGLSAISSLAISADGRHLYTAGQYDSAVAVFRVADDPPDPPDPPSTLVESSSNGCFIRSLSSGITDARQP